MKTEKKKPRFVLIAHDVASGIKEQMYEKVINGGEDRLGLLADKYNEEIKSFKIIRHEVLVNDDVKKALRLPLWRRLWNLITGREEKFYYCNVVYDKLDEEYFVNSHIYGSYDDAMIHKEQTKALKNFEYICTLAFRSDYPYYEWKFNENSGHWE